MNFGSSVQLVLRSFVKFLRKRKEKCRVFGKIGVFEKSKTSDKDESWKNYKYGRFSASI